MLLLLAHKKVMKNDMKSKGKADEKMRFSESGSCWHQYPSHSIYTRSVSVLRTKNKCLKFYDKFIQ